MRTQIWLGSWRGAGGAVRRRRTAGSWSTVRIVAGNRYESLARAREQGADAVDEGAVDGARKSGRWFV